jgi:hypothetical protein
MYEAVDKNDESKNVSDHQLKKLEATQRKKAKMLRYARFRQSKFTLFYKATSKNILGFRGFQQYLESLHFS